MYQILQTTLLREKTSQIPVTVAFNVLSMDSLLGPDFDFRTAGVFTQGSVRILKLVSKC